MNGKDLLAGLSYVDMKLYEEAEALPGRKARIPRPVLIAALIALMVLLMGCAVAWRLMDMKIGDSQPSASSYIGPDGNLAISSEPQRAVYTIHGRKGSPVYEAAREWFAFQEAYDPDRSRMAQNEDFPVPEAYEAYTPVYTQEMLDKIDEIAQRYGLRLLGALAVFQRNESTVFYDALDIDSLLVPDGEGIAVNESGYFYEGGNFKVTFDLMLSKGMEQWLCSMYYSQADCFDDVSFTILDPDAWEQSVYTTKAGTEVYILASIETGEARFFHFREDAVISMGISGSFSDEDLKRIAEEINFGITVDSVDMALARRTLEKFNLQPDAAPEEPGFGSDRQKDFAGFVAWHREEENNISYPVTHYAFYDINDDGREELLFGTEEKIYEIIEQTPDAARLWLMGNESEIVSNHFAVCENGIVLEYEQRQANTSFTYRKFTSYDPVLGNWDTKPLIRANYAPEGEYPYTQYDYTAHQFLPIQKEEYERIVNGYQPVEIEMKSLDQYPEG